MKAQWSTKLLRQWSMNLLIKSNRAASTIRILPLQSLFQRTRQHVKRASPTRDILKSISLLHSVFNQSFVCSSARSISGSLTRALARSSLKRSLAPSLNHSLARSIDRSLPRSLNSSTVPQQREILFIHASPVYTSV